MSSLLITDPRGRPKAEEMLLRLHLSDDWNKDSCKLKSIPQHKTKEDDGFESFIKNEHPIKDRQKEQSSDDCESESESYFQWFMKQKITKWIIVTIIFLISCISYLIYDSVKTEDEGVRLGQNQYQSFMERYGPDIRWEDHLPPRARA